MNSIKKAVGITDARISFVSLVDKAANKRKFLITKAQDGQANFETFGRVIKKDIEKHYVTGIVYEPMTEDTQGNYMTADEIQKAALWFKENGGSVDIQHSFEPFNGAKVVESYVAKADSVINGEVVKAGSWLMTVEITDAEIWKSIENGDITGFSMGGVGKYDEEDVPLVTKSDERGLFKRFADFLGFRVVDKGEVQSTFDKKSQEDALDNAFYSLKSTLRYFDRRSDTLIFEPDKKKVRDALNDFNSIISEIFSLNLAADEVTKSGRTLSAKNRELLQQVHNNLGALLAEADNDNKEKQEDFEMTESEIGKKIDAAVKKALPETDASQKKDIPGLTMDALQKMIESAVEKVLEEKTHRQTDTGDNIDSKVDAAVKKALEPILKARALPVAMENDDTSVEKGEAHYLTGIL